LQTGAVFIQLLVDCGARYGGQHGGCRWLLPRAYRSVLWRRRKSVVHRERYSWSAGA
jgi:hypothetical protein